MPKTKTAGDIMVTKLVTFTEDMDVVAAIEILLKHRISGAPVLDSEGRYVGYFSEKNCMNVLISDAMQRLPTTTVGAFATSDVHSIEPETNLLTIAQIFSTKNLRRLPVLVNGELVGQVSRRDVLSAIVKLLRPEKDRKSRPLYLSASNDVDVLPR